MLLPVLALVLSTLAQIEARSIGRYAQVIERETAANNTYDFIISGGGLAGLTLADRLTENPQGENHQYDQQLYLLK